MHGQHSARNRHTQAKRGKSGRKAGRNGAIVGGELQQWSQLPNESSQAYAGFLAYADLPPGYFGAWASKYRWRQRAAALESAARARLMALGGAEPTQD